MPILTARQIPIRAQATQRLNTMPRTKQRSGKQKGLTPPAPVSSFLERHYRHFNAATLVNGRPLSSRNPAPRLRYVSNWRWDRRRFPICVVPMLQQDLGLDMIYHKRLGESPEDNFI
jgi:hypothetical protein